MNIFKKIIRKDNFIDFINIDNKFNVSLYINKMYDEGNKIIFITRRANTFKVKCMTKKWLKKYGFKYHKLIMGAKRKDVICDKEGVSLFIDNGFFSYRC